jgi:acyl-homoserine-lactone acylase
MAVQFGDEGPAARAVLTYSQSEDPASPHFADQTLLYEGNTLRDVLYRAEAIDADPNLVERALVLE